MINANGPYDDYQQGDSILRVFHIDCADAELVWHRDMTDRLVTCISGDGWQLQMDNELPMELIIGVTYAIPAMVYHRLIRTKHTELIIKIVKGSIHGTEEDRQHYL